MNRWRRIAASITRRHTEWNYASVAPHVATGSRVLDVGAWNGATGALLRERRGCAVTCVDVVDQNVTDLPFLTFDGRHLPVADASHDVVTILYVLHHSAHEAELLREARRVCAPDGVILVAEDQVETWWQRVVTIGFHVWLLLFTGMGWKGRFRTVAGWRERFAAAGLVVDRAVTLGAHMGKRLWPHNVLFVLRPGRLQPTDASRPRARRRPRPAGARRRPGTSRTAPAPRRPASAPDRGRRRSATARGRR